jgi:hypothetical protein
VFLLSAQHPLHCQQQQQAKGPHLLTRLCYCGLCCCWHCCWKRVLLLLLLLLLLCRHQYQQQHLACLQQLNLPAHRLCLRR